MSNFLFICNKNYKIEKKKINLGIAPNFFELRTFFSTNFSAFKIVSVLVSFPCVNNFNFAIHDYAI